MIIGGPFLGVPPIVSRTSVEVKRHLCKDVSRCPPKAENEPNVASFVCLIYACAIIKKQLGHCKPSRDAKKTHLNPQYP